MENKMTVVETARQPVKELSASAKEWSNATPAGLVALAVACAVFFPLLTGRVQAPALPLVGAWLIGGFVIQLIVALLDLKSGNASGGNTFLFFSAYFMLVGGIGVLLKYNGVMSGSPLDARVDGYAWAVLAAVVYLWTPAFFKKFSLLSVIVALLDVALPFIALTDLQILPKSFAHISAWALLAAGLVAMYLGAAMIVNGAFGKKIYPLP